MQRGSSGATFNFLGNRVVKMAPEKTAGQRVMDQGLWLQKHQSPALPRVFQVYARSYVMERLIVPPLWALDHKVIFDHLLAALSVHVWSHSAEVEHDSNATAIKYNDLCDKFDLQRVAHDLDYLQANIEWNDLRRCLTHGDPTFDNVMFREDDAEVGVVIGDPIPATPAVPDLWCVDLGKILQSLLGWEETRYGLRSFKLRIGTDDLRRCEIDKNEWRGTIFWSVVHMLRAMPYVSDDVRRKLKGRIDAAFHLGL